MASSYTTLLGLVLPVQGELQGTWGDTVNNQLTSLLDTAIAGTTTLNTDADVTLSTTTGAANQARQQIILWTANGSVTRNITAPAQSKSYIVINASAGTQTIVIRGAGPTVGVSLVKGERAVVVWNGSDFVKVSTFGGSPSFTDLVVTGNTTLGDAAGDAVTINAGTTTFAQGTANGVTYLNGSKVLTSGSALTFDGSTLGSGFLNIGSAASFETGSRVAIKTSAGKFDVAAYGGSSVQLMSSGALAYYTPSASFDQIWLQGAGELMRLTSTGLGIGTSSPGQRLEIQAPAGASQNAVIRLRATDSASSSGSVADISAIGTGGQVSALAFSTRDGTNVLERLRLDGAGNLGLGVTPSGWGGGFKVVETIGGATGSNTSNETYLFCNTYFDTSFKYKTTAAATYLQQSAGQFRFFTAPSGTAGNAISFTQAMTLHASGGLSVGNTSDPGAGSVNTGVGAANSNNYVIRLSAGTSGLSRFIAADTSDAGYIDYEHSSDAWIFRTGGTERARITSGGDLLVGTTSAATFTPKLAVVAPGSQYGIEVQSNTVGYYAGLFTNTATSGDNYFLYFGTEANGSTQRGSITYNRAGGLVAYNTTSDYRAKDILGPVASPGATIDALKVYEGRMKGATQSRPMLVAHEAQAVAPYSVTGEKDAVNDDGSPKFQQMDVSSLVPLLIAEIQSLRARVAALEA